MTDAWSLEFEINRGFRTSNRIDEAVWLSFAPPNSTYDEIQRLGIRARFDRTQRVGPGFAAHAMWQSRKPGRLNVGLFAGISARAYDSQVVRTTLFVPPELNLPPDRHDLQAVERHQKHDGRGSDGWRCDLRAPHARADRRPRAALFDGHHHRRPVSHFPRRRADAVELLADVNSQPPTPAFDQGYGGPPKLHAKAQLPKDLIRGAPLLLQSCQCSDSFR